MKPRSYQLGLTIGLGALLMFSSCKQTGAPGGTSTLSLRRISIPSRLFTIAGEALAFEAVGGAGHSGEASISLRRLQTRFGKFNHADVYEYDKQGKVFSQQSLNVDPDSAIAFKATSERRYLIYPDLGPRYRNTYIVACNLGRARLAGQIVPRICTQILCTDGPFQASQLFDRIPELKTHATAADLGDGIIGGFGRQGSICDQCLGRSEPGGSDFVPATGCSERVPSDTEPPANPEVIVYTHSDYPTNADWHYQIYRTKSDGTDVTNLSNNENFERSPDVNHHSARIVFWSGGQNSGLVLMDLNGNGRTLIPGTVTASHPKWSRDAESFIVYVDLESNVNNSIHRVRPDGTDNVEVVHADGEKVILIVEVIDDFHILYSQDDGTGRDSDLFIKDMRDSSAAVNLTNSADVAEEFPVISHDGSLIAYRAYNPKNFQGYDIVIARVTLPSTLTELHRIRLSAPAGAIFGDLDFSNDDTRLYVESSVVETEGTTNTSQLFSINVDGSGQFRVTVNDETDDEPSVAPRR